MLCHLTFSVSVVFLFKTSTYLLLSTNKQYIHTMTTAWTTGVRFLAGAGIFFFSSPPRPDRLWAPASLLSNGYRGKGVKVTTQLRSMPRLKMQYVFMMWDLVKHRDIVSFLLTLCHCFRPVGLYIL